MSLNLHTLESSSNYVWTWTHCSATWYGVSHQLSADLTIYSRYNREIKALSEDTAFCIRWGGWRTEHYPNYELEAPAGLKEEIAIELNLTITWLTAYDDEMIAEAPNTRMRPEIPSIDDDRANQFRRVINQAAPAIYRIDHSVLQLDMCNKNPAAFQDSQLAKLPLTKPPIVMLRLIF